MYFKIILNYILGYVNILVEGYFVEKFINICNKQKIFLWNLKRSKTTIIYANVSIKDFKKLNNYEVYKNKAIKKLDYVDKVNKIIDKIKNMNEEEFKIFLDKVNDVSN